MAVQEVRVPDLEGAQDVGVVEIYVDVGDTVEVESPLISLESDKAVMDVPSPLAGIVKEVALSEGDSVNTGDIILLIAASSEAPVETPMPEEEDPVTASEGESAGSESVEIPVPDLEGAADVAVVEIYVGVGDVIDQESPLISLESDKAVMDVPSPVSGKITEIRVDEGSTVNTGDIIAVAEVDSSRQSKPADSGRQTMPIAAEEAKGQDSSTAAKPDTIEPAGKTAAADSETMKAPVNAQPIGGKYHATPSVRSFARELGVDLAAVKGSGPKGRITRDDVSSLVKKVMGGVSPSSSASSAAGGFVLPPIPQSDYSVFGEVEIEALPRIKKISGPHLHRNWVGVPHVTQFEDADMTDLEAFRQSLNEDGAAKGETKVSPLIFVIKAVVHALKEFPDFNSSLNSDAATITRKKYYNIGIAVDTPGGLVVPVLKNADTKGIRTLAEELSDLSSRAREGKLKPDEMKGGTFSISSLGGIGGTYFTPIVNAPEVAILGLSRSAMKPVWGGNEFLPRLILPLSVSYDHRVIDGAQGARFASYLASVIGDIRRALL